MTWGYVFVSDRGVDRQSGRVDPRAWNRSPLQNGDDATDPHASCD